MRISKTTQDQVIGLLEEIAFAIQTVHQENDRISREGTSEQAFALEAYEEGVSSSWKNRSTRIVLPDGTWLYLSLHERMKVSDELRIVG